MSFSNILVLALVAFTSSFILCSSFELIALTRNRHCGRLLVGLAKYCASTKYSKKEICCPVIRLWNRNLCWCQKNAYDAASNLALDKYAFQFRASQCEVNDFKHPKISLPLSSKVSLPDTCPSSKSGSTDKHSEDCASFILPQSLRKQRLEFLKRLSSLNVVTSEEISTFVTYIEALIAPEAILYLIGTHFSFGRDSIKEYLLYRTSLGGGALWTSNIIESTISWTSSTEVSYTSTLTLGIYSFLRIDFVIFESCSPRIVQLYSQEEDFINLFKQYVYFDPPHRLFWKAFTRPDKMCSRIASTCSGKHYPFSDERDCQKFYNRMWSEKNVTCGKSRAGLAALIFQGDTISCREAYLNLASQNSDFCRFLGLQGVGKCRKTSCERLENNNLFTEMNPRYDSVMGYTCSENGCTENWPS